MTVSLDHPQRDVLFDAAYLTGAAAVLCLVPPLLKRLYAKRRRNQPQVLIEHGPAFDERKPSRSGGTNHVCKVRVFNCSDRIITNGRIKLVDLVPEHQGHHAFFLRDNITLAARESVMVNIASHVEGAEDNAGLMSLQLPILGAFYMAAGRGIITQEHQFTVRFERENERICDKRFRLYVDRINVMHLSEII